MEKNKQMKQNTTSSIVALVCGIISIVLCWAPFIGIVLGVTAIVFGGMSMKKVEGRGIAIAGLVTGIVGLVLSVIYNIFWLISAMAISSVMDIFNNF